MENGAQISVVLNGERRNIPAGSGFGDLLESLSLPIQGVLVEQNGRALLRDELASARLEENDRLEILRVVAGG